MKITELPTGIHLGVPADVYHERVLGMVSKSALDHVHQSPSHYKAWIDGLVAEEGRALDFGGAFHVALLEPERFADTYTLMPRFDEHRDRAGKGSTKAFKEAVAAWRELNADKRTLDAEDMSTIERMVASVRAHPLASAMIRDGLPEVTLRWRDEETGLECRARADYYVRARRMVVDVKTSRDASFDEFRRSVVNYRYHVQDALYRGAFAAVGEPIQHFVFVVVEKAPPYAVAVYTLDSDGIQRGYAHARRDIATLAECLRNDAYPGYPMTIQTLDLPPWAA